MLKSLLYLNEEVDEEKVFNAYGMDSILGIEFIKRINTYFNVNITASKLYDFPAVKTLADYLIEMLLKKNKHSETNINVLQKLDINNDLQQTSNAISLKMIATNIAFDQYHNLQSPDIKNSRNSNLEGKAGFNKNNKIQMEGDSVNQAIKDDEIAIIGMAAYLPHAKDIDILWENLKTGRSSITAIPPQRWSINHYYSPNTEDKSKSYSKWGGFIEDIDQFDPLFFGISPLEAEWMDPQQRLFLEVSWSALEDAGYTPSLDRGRCGVYVGVMNNDYREIIQRANVPTPSVHKMLGNSNSILAARIAYFLNLKGPVITVDTACSSSLVATHLACQALQTKQADLMLVGGVTLYLTETPYIEMCKAGMLSKDGLCKTFDNHADGFVPGEGCSVLVLKRLQEAIIAGDHIYGIIRGSGVNQDGRTNGITAPSAESQKALEVSIYQENHINSEDITYVEAHGTGTKLGDPIEIEALTGAFKEFTDKRQFCALGSLKSNIGHTSAAAGVASVIKVLLQLKISATSAFAQF